MCGVTEAAIAGLIISAGSAAYSFDQQNKMAQYQNELNEYNNKLSARNLADNMNTLAFNQNAERDAAVEQIWRDDLEARRAEARARVAAGESGVAGQTIESVMREIKAQQAMYAASVNQNLDRINASMDGERRQVWNNYLSEIGNRTPGVKGSALALGLQIAGAGVSAYDKYQDGKFREEYLKDRRVGTTGASGGSGG